MSAHGPRIHASFEAAAIYLQVRPRTLRIWLNRGLIESRWTDLRWQILLPSLLAFEKPNPLDDDEVR